MYKNIITYLLRILLLVSKLEKFCLESILESLTGEGRGSRFKEPRLLAIEDDKLGYILLVVEICESFFLGLVIKLLIILFSLVKYLLYFL